MSVDFRTLEIFFECGRGCLALGEFGRAATARVASGSSACPFLDGFIVTFLGLVMNSKSCIFPRI